MATQSGQQDGLELGGAVISVVSIPYFLLNLLATLVFLGASGIAGSVGAGGVAAAAGIAGVVYLILTVGFIVAPIGAFKNSSWGWPVMAGVWSLNLLWSVSLMVTGAGGFDPLGLIFILINVAILAWIYMNKHQQLPIGDSQTAPSV